jgi:hypothetical protein
LLFGIVIAKNYYEGITAYTSRNIQPTLPYGGGSVMVWGVSLMTASWI